jgi:tetratricopeptide (TPR) repeat protein
MAKKRLTRKELLKEPDEFITLTGRLIAWVKANPKKLIYGIGVFLAVVLIGSGYAYYQENRAQTAADLLSQSLLKYEEIAAQGDAAKALDAVTADLDRLGEDFSGQAAGKLGIILYGHLCLKAHLPQKAIGLYQKGLDNFENDPALTPVILNGLALAQEAAKDVPAAIACFEKILSRDTSLYKDSALFHLGRLYANTGQPEKSRQMYERLGTEFPESAYVEIAREKAAS